MSIEGKQFNKLTVVGRGTNDKWGAKTWKCKCSCGNETNVRDNNLKIGRVKSCGCLVRSGNSNRKSPYHHLFTTLVRTSRHRNKQCELTFDQFKNFTNQSTCHYCGAEIKWNKYSTNGMSGPYNLDRKNSDEGYSVSNCVVCCELCNYTKRNVFSYYEMLKLGNIIREIREERRTVGNFSLV